MTGAFGQNTASTGGLFGSTATNTGGLFGLKLAETKPLFGSTNTGFAAPSSSGGLFDSSTTTPSFGQTTETSTGSFAFGQNTQQDKPGGFSFLPSSNNTTGGGLFGQQQPVSTTATSSTGSSLFGTQNAVGTASSGLFGSSTTNASNAFGAQNKPFAFATPANTTGLFSTTGSGGLFGSGTGSTVGTTIKYQPITATDTMTLNSTTTNIKTRFEVITCMKEYKNKSLEELRVEDYLTNRNGPGQRGGLMTGAFGQKTASTGGFFGSTATNTGGLFGQKPAETKPLVESTNTGFAAPSSSGGLFGSSTTTPSFGQTTGTSTGSFAFGQNTQQNKPGGTGSTVGTTIKYQPITATDTMTRNSTTTNIQTRIEVITCMK
ncbi:nuclear pore complex protein Nup98-Nup96-like, partial [Hyalella azteca]|uniref:Nuclear pore complex protein Nup98-Nup96 n=1 Tax=Hyalella azteca TaxID=294128 RepID=A0A8B7PAM9_HYAAZ